MHFFRGALRVKTIRFWWDFVTYRLSQKPPGVFSEARGLLFGLSLHLLLYSIIFCMQEVKALMRLWAVSSEPSLLADVISTKILCAGPYSFLTIFFSLKLLITQNNRFDLMDFELQVGVYLNFSGLIFLCK